MEEVAKAYAVEKGLQFDLKLAEGAFKETYRVFDGLTPVALKVVGLKASDARTEREVDAIVRCDHPSIARLIAFDKFAHGSSVYTCLIEEYLGGGTLSDRFKTAPLSRSQGLRVGRELISVLDHLSKLGLVHRDIKPDNIMFRNIDSWDPVLVDFGLVRDLSRSSLTQTWSPMGPGTPLFAPPEQLNNRKELIDWRSDQFALAVTISVALGIHFPHWEPADRSFECIDRVAAYLKPSSVFRQEVSAQGLEVLERMVMPFPIERFRTTAQLTDAWPNEEESR